MKLCPICEKRIIDRWCGSCLRRVEPWIISEGVYINERHSRSVTPDCEYHNPQIQYSRQEYMAPGYENRIYGKSIKPAVETTNRPTSRATARKTSVRRADSKKNKWVMSIFVIYFVCIALFAIIPFVMNYLENMRMYENTLQFNDIVVEPESYTVTEVDDTEKYAYLEGITPAKVDEGTDEGEPYKYSYYESSDLKQAGHSCDEEHMELYYQDFVTMLDRVYPGYLFTYTIDDMYEYNVVKEMPEYTWATFETFAIIGEEDFTIEVSYDSATEQIHYYLIYADEMTQAYLEEVYKWLDYVAPEAFASYNDFEKYMKNLVKDEGYSYIDLDDLSIYFAVYDEYVLVDFETLYQ